MVNVDADTLRLVDSIAVLSRQSRSAVVADVLQAFAPMFEPVALVLDKVRSQPSEAVRLLREHADTLHTVTADLVERVRSDPVLQKADQASTAGAAAAEAGRPRAKRGPRPPAQ